MNVTFYANLRQLVGSRQVEFPLPPGSTLRQLVDVIVKAYPVLQTEMLDPQGNLNPHIHFFVNGRESTLLEGSLDTILEPDCNISVFPPVGGG